jgi:hypothetical protein
MVVRRFAYKVAEFALQTAPLHLAEYALRLFTSHTNRYTRDFGNVSAIKLSTQSHVLL